MPKKQFELVAAIDLGSNSFHMIVARIQDGQLSIIDRIREMVRLADGIDKRGNIAPHAHKGALECLQRFGERLKELPRGAVRVVGTNTLRNAANAGSFLAQAEKALGHSIDIIAGVEEARLIYLGVAHSLAVNGQRRFVMDIGGSSTELIIGDSYTPKHMESLEMGCVTTTQRYFADGVITKQRIKQACLFARIELEPHVRTYKNLGWEQAIGASGSIRSIKKVLVTSGLSNGTITLDNLHALTNKIVETGSIDAQQLEGLNPERAPVFIGGLVILKATFEALGIKEMEVSDRALREGLLHDLMGRFSDEDVREKSISYLAQRYHADQDQSQRVATTARQLFDKVANKWSKDKEASEQWLKWAAQLYEIGLEIAHSRHHHHAAYIIEYSDLSGFSQQEQQLLAALVRSHRRKLPVKLYKELPKRICKPVKRLAILLRLAVILHRNRSNTPLPELALSVKEKTIRLGFPEGWLNNQPLTQADLQQEVHYLSAIGFTLTIE